MASLVVRNIDTEVVQALKKRASQHGVSAEAEHREILKLILLKSKRKCFSEVLAEIPCVGLESDFERINESREVNVFD